MQPAPIQHRRHPFARYLLGGLTLFLLSCSGGAGDTDEVLGESVAAPPDPTAMVVPTPEPTATPAPTATPTPEPTATAVPTSTPTPQPTVDPLLTLTEGERNFVIAVKADLPRFENAVPAGIIRQGELICQQLPRRSSYGETDLDPYAAAFLCPEAAPSGQGSSAASASTGSTAAAPVPTATLAPVTSGNETTTAGPPSGTSPVPTVVVESTLVETGDGVSLSSTYTIVIEGGGTSGGSASGGGTAAVECQPGQIEIGGRCYLLAGAPETDPITGKIGCQNGARKIEGNCYLQVNN